MAHFGICPRVFCQSAHVIPCGRADMPGVDTVKLACPNCGDIYVPPSSKYAGLDGASLLGLWDVYAVPRPCFGIASLSPPPARWAWRGGLVTEYRPTPSGV